MTTRSEKNRLRAAIKEKISRLNAEEKKQQSSAICEKLLSLLPAPPAIITAYAPLPDEVDIRPILLELLNKKYDLYLPRYVEGNLSFHRVESLDELSPGSLAVHEPPHDAPPLDPAALSVVLVPGRAFDMEGNRLGRGKGGYDRWIMAQRKENPATKFWGIAFREQIVETVPMEEHDQKMDTVVTQPGN